MLAHLMLFLFGELVMSSILCTVTFTRIVVIEWRARSLTGGVAANVPLLYSIFTALGSLGMAVYTPAWVVNSLGNGLNWIKIAGVFTLNVRIMGLFFMVVGNAGLVLVSAVNRKPYGAWLLGILSVLWAVFAFLVWSPPA